MNGLETLLDFVIDMSRVWAWPLVIFALGALAMRRAS